MVLAVAGPALAADLTEGNAAAWGSFASDGAVTSVHDDGARVRVGASSLRLDTQSGYDTGIAYPASGVVHLDVRAKNYFSFSTYAINTSPYGFQGNQPVVVIQTSGGSYRYEPQGTLTVTNVWQTFRVPLSGDSKWVRTKVGTPSLSDVTRIEIHQDTWDFGFTIWYDGIDFVQLRDLTTTIRALKELFA
ncbi:MAG: hypothetical protein ACR2HV_08505 [Acidimicrobiales bacterium]